MNRVAPVDPQQLSGSDADVLRGATELMGFVSNDALTMARVPGLLEASAKLVHATYSDGSVPGELKRLLAYMTSRAGGCVYCEAHTAHGAARAGIAPERIAAIWDFETNSTFSEAERAALQLARDAAFVPSAVTDDNFATLKKHYDDDQIAEIVAVLALFAFLNRWNSTLATPLEDMPQRFLNQHPQVRGGKTQRQKGT